MAQVTVPLALRLLAANLRGRAEHTSNSLQAILLNRSLCWWGRLPRNLYPTFWAKISK